MPALLNLGAPGRRPYQDPVHRFERPRTVCDVVDGVSGAALGSDCRRDAAARLFELLSLSDVLPTYPTTEDVVDRLKLVE